MPRYLSNTASVKKRLSSRDGYYIKRATVWVDPFPEVHGTLPEKMVYGELTRLGIPFYFLNDVNIQIPDLDLNEWFQADFIIPDAKIIIEVQGSYWHSMEKTIQADAYKFALYETQGYKPLAWWDFDIYARLHELVFSEPALLGLARPQAVRNSMELVPLRRTKVDTSKGIRTLNHRRKVNSQPRFGRRKMRKGVSVYGTR